MLDGLAPAQNLTAAHAGAVLDAVHLETLTSYTLYSNVHDLAAGKLTLYYMGQYGDPVELDLADELEKGQRVVEMRDLFAPETAQDGDAAYRRFEARLTAVKVGVVSAGLALLAAIAGGIVLVVRRKRPLEKTRKKPPRVSETPRVQDDKE
jgi:hypothetical protein